MSRGQTIFVIGMLAAVAFSASQSATAADAVNLTERANRVRQMTAEERARLQKNIEKFQQLSPQDQAAYRQLSATVESDPALKQLMSTYTAWLQTLTPGQREELRLEQDINKRRDLVERFRKEQIEKEELPLPELEPGGRMTPPPPLTKDELAAVLKLIEDALPEDRKKLLPVAKDDIGRLERASAIGGALFRTVMEGGKADFVPVEKMLAAVESPAAKSYLEAADRQRRLVGAWSGVIAMSVRQEVEKELQQRTPSDQLLSKYFTELEPSQRFELNQFRGNDWKREMIRAYLRENPDPDYERLLRLRWWRGFGERGPGGRGPGSDGPGGPGGFEGRGPLPQRAGEGGGPPRPGERVRNFLDNGPPGGPRPPGPPPGDAK